MTTGIDYILGTSLLVVVTILLRKIWGRKCNPNIRYLLWIFVAVRILVPFEITWEIPESVLPESSVIVNMLPGERTIAGNEESVNFGKESADVLHVQKGIPSNTQMDTAVKKQSEMITGGLLSDAQPSVMAEESSVNERRNLEEILGNTAIIVWIAGSVLMGGYVVIANLHTFAGIKKQKVDRLDNKLDIYETDGYNCLVGIINPGIYVSSQVLQDEEKYRYVLLHEMEHFRVKDNFWLLLRTLCLIVQWFNPFVWMAYSMSQEDCELACDYRVLQRLNPGQRENYAETLLHILRMNTGSRKVLTTAMGDNKRIMKKRLEDIFSAHKRKRWTDFAILAVVLLVVSVTFLSCTVKPVQEKVEDTESQISLMADAAGSWMDLSGELLNRYAVLDLDQNRRLDLVVSCMSGSGRYTTSRFYEVNETYDGLTERATDFAEGESQPDIMSRTGYVNVYEDDLGKFHYILSDYVPIGSGVAEEYCIELTVMEGQILDTYLGIQTEMQRERENPLISYDNADGEAVTEPEYLVLENAVCAAQGGIQKKYQVLFGWQDTVDLEGLDYDGIYKMLSQSYAAGRWEAVEIPANINEEMAVELDSLWSEFANKDIYIKTVQKLETEGILPDGNEAYVGNSIALPNSVALLDVDGDGIEELLLDVGGSCMADMKLCVFQYDGSIKGDYPFREEFGAWPSVRFYTNGIVFADLSHNHGYSALDDFWPYSVYQYDENADTYQYVWNVDAWEKRLWEEDYDGIQFPDDIDADDDGVVYRITDAVKEELFMMDKADYEAWRLGLLETAEEIQIPWTQYPR